MQGLILYCVWLNNLLCEAGRFTVWVWPDNLPAKLTESSTRCFIFIAVQCYIWFRTELYSMQYSAVLNSAMASAEL